MGSLTFTVITCETKNYVQLSESFDIIFNFYVLVYQTESYKHSKNNSNNIYFLLKWI